MGYIVTNPDGDGGEWVLNGYNFKQQMIQLQILSICSVYVGDGLVQQFSI